MYLTCADCGEAKPATDYYKDTSKSSGYHHHCKPCARKRSTARYRRRTGSKVPDSRECEICSTTFKPLTGMHIYCSEKCSTRAQRLAKNPHYQSREEARRRRADILPGWQSFISACTVCMAMFMSDHPSQITCSEECKKENKRRRAKLKSDRRRARMHGVEYEPIERTKVFERDEWNCGICGESIDPELKYPDHMSASVDHIIPVSEGGAHAMDNVHATHWICNVHRGVKPLLELTA